MGITQHQSRGGMGVGCWCRPERREQKLNDAGRADDRRWMLLNKVFAANRCPPIALPEHSDEGCHWLVPHLGEDRPLVPRLVYYFEGPCTVHFTWLGCWACFGLGLVGMSRTDEAWHGSLWLQNRCKSFSSSLSLCFSTRYCWDGGRRDVDLIRDDRNGWLS